MELGAVQIKPGGRPKPPIAGAVPRDTHPLRAFFSPRNVAVIGATEKQGSVGRTLIWNLLSTPFGGTVYPVNPKRSNVLGIKAYPAVSEVPEQVDLAIITTPAPLVPGLIGECVQAGVRNAVIISAGFKEVGPEGVLLEQQIKEEAARGNMRIIGPNCLGIMCPISGLNATFATTIARPGSVGFISQSGALCTAILDWSLQNNVGFSAFMSLGSMLDVGWGDLIYYLGDDPNTKSIVIYMESIGDARAFLSAAREVALSKPIIVIKVGRTAAAAKAAASHTGSLTGSDEVLDAAFRRCGVLRVEAIEDLFDMAGVLSMQPRPRGKRLTILTNAGGPGVLATDALIKGGGELTELSVDTQQALDECLPPQWSHNNPIDILGDADRERYAKAIEIAGQDPNSDGLLVILTPQAMTDATEAADCLRDIKLEGKKPLLASWMGGRDVAAGARMLTEAGIPNFSYPDSAVRMFNYMWRYAYNLRGLYETPWLPMEGDGGPDRASAEAIIRSARESGRTLLTEFESKELLAAYGIETVTTRIARTGNEAVAAAESIGFPVVVKLHSETITHKTDVGGVRLNLESASDVRQAYEAIQASVRETASAADFMGVTVQPMVELEGYELIIGSSVDPQFGPVLLFGAGGQLVEVFLDRALALPPLNTTLARRMMEQTQIYSALRGVRGRRPISLESLEQLLVHFSYLVVEQPWIKEIDINPLLAAPSGLTALDARVVLHDPDTRIEELPKPAIRPYPKQYEETWTLKGGATVEIRPIRPEDEPLMARFHATLSDESVLHRFFLAIPLEQRIAHERLCRICYVDYDREIALVAVKGTGDEAELLGVCRLAKLHGQNRAEYGLLVTDAYQSQGLGTELLRQIVTMAKNEKLDAIQGRVLPDNIAMQGVCKHLGFSVERDPNAPVIHVELDLRS